MFGSDLDLPLLSLNYPSSTASSSTVSALALAACADLGAVVPAAKRRIRAWTRFLGIGWVSARDSVAAGRSRSAGKGSVSAVLIFSPVVALRLVDMTRTYAPDRPDQRDNNDT